MSSNSPFVTEKKLKSILRNFLRQTSVNGVQIWAKWPKELTSVVITFSKYEKLWNENDVVDGIFEIDNETLTVEHVGDSGYKSILLIRMYILNIFL